MNKPLSTSFEDPTLSPYLPRTPNLHADTPTLRASLRAYFVATWERYESLFECLTCDEAYYEKPISLRHPLIFYLGHTATFFVNKLMLTDLLSQRVNETFESTFAVGVDEMSWDDLNDEHYDWPSPKEVFAYRDKVKALVLDLIDNGPLTSPINWQNDYWAIIMGIEHERIHLETSSVLIRQQKLEWVQPHPDWPPCQFTGDAPDNTLVHIEAGTVDIGKEFDDPTYGWDNEYGHHHADISAFDAAKYLVSNREYLAFVEDAGYANARYWGEEGQQWQQYAKRTMPEFWRKHAGKWKLRLMCEEIDMPWDWPVEVNFHEAEAFCAWKAHQTGEAIRLPTEDEWYRLYDDSQIDVRPNDRWNANIHLDHWASSCPVDIFKQGELYDVAGNVWQWTQTAMYPFENFDVHPYYDDFTVPTFDDQHALIKGGSWISCGNEAERSSRYAFRRHFFQHAGFRYVRGELKRTAPSSKYETNELLSQYDEFHYGDSYLGVPNFPKAIVDLIHPHLNGRRTRKAMDLGCAVGRASFELSRMFDKVVGVDFSARFINQGVQFGRDGILRYALTDEGEIFEFKTRTLKELGLDNVRVPELIQGDACNLKPILTDFDLVLAANLIDRLYAPAEFLEDIHSRILPNGLLVIASPYTWLQEHTPRKNWIGGFKKDGENVRTLDGLKHHLNPHFKLLQEPVNVPFVIRETSRKFQHTLSEVTIWERRNNQDT